MILVLVYFQLSICNKEHEEKLHFYFRRLELSKARSGTWSFKIGTFLREVDFFILAFH